MKNMKKNYYAMVALLCSFSLYCTQVGIQMVSHINDISKDVALVITGKNEQLILSGSIMRDYKMGTLHKEKVSTVYLPRTLNYESLENVYQKNHKIGVRIEKDLDVEIITVTEPILDQEVFWCAKGGNVINDYVYQPMKKPSKRPMLGSSTFEIRGEKAFEEAKKDLIFCYHNALSYIAQEKKMRSIALLTLGIVTGFPWQVAVEIAISSVCEYVKKRPHDYTKIWLCTIKTWQDNSYQDNSYEQVYEKYWMELLKSD
jgi:hypothetical protein